MMVRVVKLCHFQPRLGIITRSLANAASDLAHYVVILVILFLGSACLACLVFGGVTLEFSTFGHSFQSLFNMMAFQDSGFMDKFFYLPSPLNVPGLMFYYSFALIMCAARSSHRPPPL